MPRTSECAGFGHRVFKQGIKSNDISRVARIPRSLMSLEEEEVRPQTHTQEPPHEDVGTWGEHGIYTPRTEASAGSRLSPAWISDFPLALPGSETPGLSPTWISGSRVQPCLDLRLPASALPGPQPHSLSPGWISDSWPRPCLNLRPRASALPVSQTPNLSPAWISDPQSRSHLDLRLPASALPGSHTPSLSFAWISDPQPHLCLDLRVPASTLPGCHPPSLSPVASWTNLEDASYGMQGKPLKVCNISVLGTTPLQTPASRRARGIGCFLLKKCDVPIAQRGGQSS